MSESANNVDHNIPMEINSNQIQSIPTSAQYQQDLQAAKSAIKRLFSLKLALEFDNVIIEGEYNDGQEIIDDIQDENDSNIIDGLTIHDQSQLPIFRELFVQIFQHHNYDIDPFRQRVQTEKAIARYPTGPSVLIQYNASVLLQIDDELNKIQIEPDRSRYSIYNLAKKTYKTENRPIRIDLHDIKTKPHNLPSINVTLGIDEDFDTFDREKFIDEFAMKFGIDKQQIFIKSIKSGSVIIDMEIKNNQTIDSNINQVIDSLTSNKSDEIFVGMNVFAVEFDDDKEDSCKNEYKYDKEEQTLPAVVEQKHQTNLVSAVDEPLPVYFNYVYRPKFIAKWLHYYDYNNHLLYELSSPYRLLNTLKLLQSSVLIKPLNFQSLSRFDVDVMYGINSILSESSQIDEEYLKEYMFLDQVSASAANIVTCPSHHQQQQSSTTNPVNRKNDNNEKNNHRRNNNNEPNDNNNQNSRNNSNGDKDRDGDGDDEKQNNPPNNDQQYENLTREQLLAILQQKDQIIQQKEQTIQQKQQIIQQRDQTIQQQQIAINSLQSSHQILINNTLLSLSVRTMQDNNQLQQENQNLKSIAHEHMSCDIQKQKQVHKNVSKKTKTTPNKTRDGNSYYCEPPPKIRAYRNIRIPPELKTIIKSKTTKNFDNVKCNGNHKNPDECKCDGLSSWMDIDIAMHPNDNIYHINGKCIRIFNPGFKEGLFCVVEATKRNKQKQKFPWQMHDKLYTKEMILQKYEINEWQLPNAVRESARFNIQEMEQVAIKAFLEDHQKFIKLIGDTNWCKIKIFSRLNNKRRTTLFITKSEVQNELKIQTPSQMKLIPILLFQKNDYQIHYLIVIAMNDSHIGISMIWEKKSETVKVTGIHIDKEMICRQHQWISLKHVECSCLDNFNSSITHLKIGNIDEDANKIKDLKRQLQNEKLKKEKRDSNEWMQTQQSCEFSHDAVLPLILKQESNDNNTPRSPSTASSIYNRNYRMSSVESSISASYVCIDTKNDIDTKNEVDG